MRRLPAYLLPLLLATGCDPVPPVAPPPAVPPAPPATPAQPAASAAPAETPAQNGYSGLGLSSVSPEMLARFAPPPLPSELSRRIQSMMDVRSPAQGMLSPDGKQLYFTWTVSGTRQIWRIDGPQRFPVQMTGGEDATSLVDITPDGKWLIVSRDRKGEENPGLYLQSKDGGPLLEIQHKSGVQTFAEHVSDDGKFLYYRSNDVKPDSYVIYRYEIATKKREAVFSEPGLWSLDDTRRDGRMLLAKHVGGNMAEYYEWDPKKKALTPLFGQGEREDYRAVYGAADDEILVLTPKLSEYRRLYQYKGGKFNPLSPEIKFDVTRFQIDDAKKRITYHVNERGYTRLAALDAKSFKELKLPAFPPADHVVAGATTRDGRYTTIGIDPGTAPMKSYVLDWQSGKLTDWHTPSTPELDTSRFARATLEEYPARDGTKIPMFVRRPASCNKPCPVVVSFHGGPEGQARPGFSTRAQMFVDAGFVFVEPNVRGSEGYGKTWLHADDGPKRLDIITDIEDCAKFIHEKWSEGGKAPKVGIMGGSYGGYSSLVGMTMFAGAYDVGVEIVGISNLLSFLQNTAPYRRALRTSEYGDPEKDKEALLKLSPITYVDKLKAPMLLIQGANDPRVPVGEAVQIHQAMEAKKLPGQLIIFADEGHGAQKRDNQVLMIGHTLRFFEEHLLGKPRLETRH